MVTALIQVSFYAQTMGARKISVDDVELSYVSVETEKLILMMGLV